MSSRIFQGVIVQMKEATDRCIGVVDEQGFVIACSELATIGSRLEDFAAAVSETQEQLFSTPERTFKILGGSAARFEYAVFVEGTDTAARSICILAAIGMTEASTNFPGPTISLNRPFTNWPIPYVQKSAPVRIPKSDLLQPSPSIITAPAFERFSRVQYRKQYNTENSIKYRHA